MVSVSVVRVRFVSLTLLLLLSKGRPVASYIANYTRYQDLFSIYYRVLRESKPQELIHSKLAEVQIAVPGNSLDEGNLTVNINEIKTYVTPVVPIFNPPFVCTRDSILSSDACQKMIQMAFKVPMERNTAFLILTMGTRVALYLEHRTQQHHSETKICLIVELPAITMSYFFKYSLGKCNPATVKADANAIEIDVISIEFGKGTSREAISIRSEYLVGISQGSLVSQLGEFYFNAYFSNVYTNLVNTLKVLVEDAIAQVFTAGNVVDQFCSVIV